MTLKYRLLQLSTAKLFPLAIIFSIFASEIIVCGMEFLLKKQITYDYLLTGFVASLCVSALVVTILNLFIEQQVLMVHRLQLFSQQINTQANELFEKNRQLLCNEEERHKNEQRLNALFENMSDGVAIYQASADGQEFFFTGFNRAAEHIEKIGREQLLGKNVKEIFPAVEQFGLLAVFRRVWASGVDEYFPLAFYDDGHIKGWRENYIYKLPTGEIVAIYEDVTRRKQMEEALRQSEAQFRAMIEASPVPYALSNREQNIIFVNTAFTQLFGYTLRDVPTLTAWWTQSCPDDDYRQWVSALWQAHLMQARQNDTLFDPLELEIHGKNGAIKTVIASMTLLSSKRVNTHLLIFYDITERKQMEAVLRQSESRFRDMFVNTPIAYFSLDQTGYFLDVNQPLCDLLGCHDDTLLAHYFVELCNHSNRERFITLFATLLARGQIDGELELLNAKGECLTVLWAGRVQHDLIGGFVCTHCVLIDISDRKRMENALNQSNADLEQFAYSVSHDMRQPLRSISSHLQLLQRAIAPNLDAENYQNLNFALDGARRMDAMIKSLLDYSRIGRKTHDKTWLASRHSLDDALDFLSPAIEEAHVDITVTGEWPLVFASHEELVRLFLNLLSNAIKYREPNQPPLITIDASITLKQWRVSVRDYGIGIDAAQMSRLFQFFSRLQSRTRFDGTGMGLALCRRIVEHHQGKIWVESEGEGYGSCFIFSLPLALDNNSLIHETIS